MFFGGQVEAAGGCAGPGRAHDNSSRTNRSLSDEVADALNSLGLLTGGSNDPEALWQSLDGWAGRENVEERMIRPGLDRPGGPRPAPRAFHRRPISSAQPSQAMYPGPRLAEQDQTVTRRRAADRGAAQAI